MNWFRRGPECPDRACQYPSGVTATHHSPWCRVHLAALLEIVSETQDEMMRRLGVLHRQHQRITAALWAHGIKDENP